MKIVNVESVPSYYLADGIRNELKDKIIVRDNRDSWRKRYELHHCRIIDNINTKEIRDV